MSDIVEEIDRYAPRLAFQVTIGHTDASPHLYIVKPWTSPYDAFHEKATLLWPPYDAKYQGFEKHGELAAFVDGWEGWLTERDFDELSDEARTLVFDLLNEDNNRVLFRGEDTGRGHRIDLTTLLVGSDEERTIARLALHLSQQAAATSEPVSNAELSEAANFIVARVGSDSG